MFNPIEILQLTGVIIVGLILRVLFFVVVVALFSTPIVLFYGIVHGWGALREHLSGFVRVGGLLFAPKRKYSSNHLWLAPDGSGGGLRLGLDDLASRLFPHARSIDVVPANSQVAAGEPLARILLSEGRSATISSPVSARVLGANPAVVSDPSLLERDPFEQGWLLRLAPDDEAWRLLRTGAEARRWLASESKRLSRLFEGELGYAAADGGELVGPAATLLPIASWEKIVCSMTGKPQ